MIYTINSEFTKLNETQGTVQNSSNGCTLELSDSNVPDSGILIYPLNKVSFSGEKYLRCVDGAAWARVVPFVLDAEGGDDSTILDGVLVIGSESSTVDGSIWLDLEG